VDGEHARGEGWQCAKKEQKKGELAATSRKKGDSVVI
jgi:hypothetical protein